MNTNGNNPGIQPLGARVLLKPIEQEDRTSSGLYLPETAKEEPQLGLVIASPSATMRRQISCR